jgi:hypothetical protein
LTIAPDASIRQAGRHRSDLTDAQSVDLFVHLNFLPPAGGS